MQLCYVRMLQTILISMIIVASQGANQYCLWDNFDATCANNEVVVVSSARYGRMASGKCLGENADNLGCSSDVLPLLDELCSGKTQCHYVVGNNGLMQNSPCEKQLMVFLEINYECVPVANPTDGHCNIDAGNHLDMHQGYISSFIARDRGCSKPWRIRGNAGQRINITLIDFTKSSTSNKCQKRGIVMDVGMQKNITICGSKAREEHIYTSNGNMVDIILNDNSKEINQEFLIKYQVLGCADLLPPDHGWYERSGDKAVLGCQHQDVKWHIQCVHDQWQGVVGNCTGSGYRGDPADNNQSAWSFMSEENFILILICCVFGVILLIIVCVLIYISWGKCVNKPGADVHQHGQSMVSYGQGPADYMAPGWSASTFNHTQGRANSMYNPAPMAPLLDAPLVEAPPPPQYSQTMSTQYRTGQYQHQHPQIPNAQQSIYTNLNHNYPNTMEKTRPMEPKYYVLDKDVINNAPTEHNLMQ